MNIKNILLVACMACAFMSCKNTKNVESIEEPIAVGPTFNADSAYLYCKQQCDFGPRTMNSEAHDRCRDWIKSEFERHGCTVTYQQANLKGYDGTMLRSTNIIASYTPRPERKGSGEGPSGEGPSGLLLCAHYDSRPWADNDPNPDNHHTPVLAANDGASGVAVMLEVARLLHAADSANIPVTFVCFDAEDYGTPQWYEGESQVEDPWALGSQYWSQQYASSSSPQGGTEGGLAWGILLDMVGGEGSKFYQEGMSLDYARDYVNRVWAAAANAGYGSYFVNSLGGNITDDHIPVNKIAGIPCIDIIPYFPDCPQSSFGPTWHTVNDTMDHISKETLSAVGQTLIQIIYDPL